MFEVNKDPVTTSVDKLFSERERFHFGREFGLLVSH